MDQNSLDPNSPLAQQLMGASLNKGGFNPYPLKLTKEEMVARNKQRFGQTGVPAVGAVN